MSLRALAAADFAAIHADVAGGFGWTVTMTDPDGVTATLTGLTTDVHLAIDPGTGVAVVGRQASLSIPRVALVAAGLGEPKGVTDRNQKPWVVTFFDVNGQTHVFKIQSVEPDNAIGGRLCRLEVYIP